MSMSEMTRVRSARSTWRYCRQAMGYRVGRRADALAGRLQTHGRSMPLKQYLAAEKGKQVRIDSARFSCVSVCVTACVYGRRFVRRLTSYTYRLFLLIGVRRLFTAYWLLDLGRTLFVRCDRNGWCNHVAISSPDAALWIKFTNFPSGSIK